MENPLAPLLSWKAFIASVVATFITSLGVLATLIGLYLNRKKPAADVHLSEAQTELAFAQAEEVRIRTRKSAKELIDDMTSQLSELEEKIRHKDEVIHALEQQIEMIKAGKIFDRNESTG